jgi:hypothetical protein
LDTKRAHKVARLGASRDSRLGVRGGALARQSTSGHYRGAAEEALENRAAIGASRQLPCQVIETGLVHMLCGSSRGATRVSLDTSSGRNPNGEMSIVAHTQPQMLGCKRVGPRVGSTFLRRVGCIAGTVPPSVLSFPFGIHGGLWQRCNVLPPRALTDRHRPRNCETQEWGHL